MKGESILILFFFFILFLNSKSTKASHFFGGEMWYESVGVDSFQFYLTVYQNCGESNDFPSGWDPVQTIAIFDKDTNLVHIEATPFTENPLDTILIPVFDTCFQVPSEICIHTKTYRSSIRYLPFIEGGYFATFQTCCLGEEIVNVIDPEIIGLSLSVNISEAALLAQNNSPVFNDIPPSFFCKDIPFSFEHNAVDSDGDSLVYNFSVPLQGMLGNPSFPPSEKLNLAQGFSSDYFFGQSSNFNLDEQNGLITGIAKDTGLFMVGVVVSDFRNGELLSQVMRTMVYSVDFCKPSILSSFDYKKNCDGSTIQFINESENATSFCWDFGFDNNCQETSPTVQFPSEGDYLITLIAEPNHGCVDTSEQILTIEKPCGFESLESGFQIQSTSLQICAGEKSQLSVPICDNYSYQWNPSPELSLDNIHNPIVSPQITTTYEVEIFDGDSCIWIAQINVQVLELCDKPVIEIPNAFTPDGDGVNDTFGGLSNFLFQNYDFKIYSRWGELVYQSNKIEDKWDGKYNGKIAVSDVYVWTLQYSYENRNEIISEIKKGDVTLIR